MVTDDCESVKAKRPQINIIGLYPGIDRAIIQQLTAACRRIVNFDFKHSKLTYPGIMVDPEPFDYDVRDCINDHGERTNFKLKDQPFYVRGRNGKMRKY